MTRTKEELKRFSDNISKMGTAQLLVFYKGLDDLDFDGLELIFKEIEKRKSAFIFELIKQSYQSQNERQ